MRWQKKHPGDGVLRELYLIKKLSTRECGRILNVAGRTICTWLREAGIARRSISEGKSGKPPARHTVEASVRSRRKYTIKGRGVIGYRLRADGYVYIYRPEHPSSTKGGYVLEHRLVMEAVIGRPLKKYEVVHHKNGKRGDNRIENLELLTHVEHTRMHYAERGIDPKTGRFLSITTIPSRKNRKGSW